MRSIYTLSASQLRWRSRQRAALRRASASASPSIEIAAQIAAGRNQRVERRADLIGVGRRRCRCQMSAGLAARRVVSSEPRPARAGRLARPLRRHLHQRAGSELRQVTQEREEAIVVVGVHDPRHAAERRARTPSRRSTTSARGVGGRRRESQGRPSNRSARASAQCRRGRRRRADVRRRTSDDPAGVPRPRRSRASCCRCR